MDGQEKEMCGNCKKEIPQSNYVMHTTHCARNFTLCKTCNEPIKKDTFQDHQKSCKPRVKKPSPPPIPLEKNAYFQQRKAVEEQKQAARRETYLKRHERLVDTGYSLKSSSLMSSQASLEESQSSQVKKEVEKERVKVEEVKSSNGAVPKPASGLLACRYCDLELPKLDLEGHEDYCGSRTDRCLECGELVMFKNKQVHMDSTHAFLKRNRRGNAAAPVWDSAAQRGSGIPESPSRRRPPPLRSFSDLNYDPLPYMPSAYSVPAAPGIKIEKGESYKEISRRLDCKTEYIRNLLHDSASITVPLRHNGAIPRNHFNHSKGPAPQPPRRRRNPPTELVIPCEFCDVPIPHEDLIQHETGCRPDLARRRPRSPEPDDYYSEPQQPTSPEVELPCEFCEDMIPASQLLRHQLTCN